MKTMDLGEEKKFGFENGRVDSRSCHTSGLDAQEWNQIGPSPCNWNLPSDSHSLSFPEASMAANASSSTIGKPVPLNWNASDAVERGEMMFSLSHFSSDTGFVERAARFSCFVSDTSNAVSEVQMQNNDAVKIEAFIKDRSTDGSPLKDQKESWEESPTTKKRKKSSDQEMEINQVQDDGKDVFNSKKKTERNSSTMATVKPSGKSSKEGEEAGKEDYIHVRARRGQATNSHSLAERVRREKISERMKFLQDLVPGCSKVTGKAVMLDEIINYVQSLQRQVEFLSMKLASVNPRLDFNLEGLLSKDLFPNRTSSSPAIDFSPDLFHHQLHSFHQGLIQVGIPGLMNPSDAYRRPVNVQLPSTSGYKDTTQQMPNAWDDDFQNVLHMTFGDNPPLKTQDLNGVPPDKYPL